MVPLPPSQADETPCVAEWCWQLIDGDLGEGDRQALENALVTDESARQTYLQAISLHAGLIAFFAPAPLAAFPPPLTSP